MELIRAFARHALSATVFMFALGVAGSSSANPVVTENVRAELVAETSGAAPGTSIWVALRLEIRQGWHTYWRNPGDSGEPTTIRWKLPDGVTASDIHWPFPQRISYGPLVNFGYEGTVLHLVQLTLPDDWTPGKPLSAIAEASWLVCQDICIPETATLRLDIPTASVNPEPNISVAREFEQTRARLPAESPWTSSYIIDGERLVLKVETGAKLADVAAATFFPYEWGGIEPSAPQELDRRDDPLVLSMTKGEAVPHSLKGVLVVSEKQSDRIVERAFVIHAVSGKDQAAISSSPALAGGSDTMTATPGEGIGILMAGFLAFLGGIILNLMPCVFPVLSIKAISLIEHGTTSPGRLRLSGISYTAGILVFMAAVGAILVAIKATGAEVGWGFQLQSPVFVAMMALVLFTLGLSLTGFFEVGASVMGWGDSFASRKDGFLGSFFTGALAALVATPCTAPFMGTAIGFAFTQTWPTTISIMLLLGAGLAFPYLVITMTPAVARWLPRPGVWMERLKQLLSFPLFAASAWMVWILSIQVTPEGILAVLMAMVLIALAIWVWQTTRNVAAHWLGSGLAIGIAGLAFVLAVSSLGAPNPSKAAVPSVDGGASLAPQEFSMQRLRELRRDGTPVFVNMTAAWCITCKVNEQTTLSSERFARALAARGVVYLKGDWTNRDDEIAAFLQSFGRSGVPLYVLYGAPDDPPRVLPQLLTPSILSEAIEALPLMPAHAQAGE